VWRHVGSEPAFGEELRGDGFLTASGLGVMLERFTGPGGNRLLTDAIARHSALTETKTSTPDLSRSEISQASMTMLCGYSRKDAAVEGTNTHAAKNNFYQECWSV